MVAAQPNRPGSRGSNQPVPAQTIGVTGAKDTTALANPPRFEVAAAQGSVTDSLLRWQQAADFGEWLNRYDDFSIGARAYHIGRESGRWYRGMTNERRIVTWDGLAVADPLSGDTPLTFFPLHLLKAMEMPGIRGNGAFTSRLPAVAKPLTDFSFERSHYGFRRVSAVHSQNVTGRLNITGFVSAADESGYYTDAKAGASQSGLSVYYGLNKRNAFHIALLNNRQNHDEPDGYEMETMPLFSFNRFFASPRDANGHSNRGANWFKAGWMLQRQDGVLRSAQLMLYRNKTDRVWRNNSDYATYNATETGIHGAAVLRVWRGDLTASGTVGMLDAASRWASARIFSATHLIRYSRESNTMFPLMIDGGLQLRGNGYHSGSVFVSMPYRLKNNIILSPFHEYRFQAPSIQERFQHGLSFEGNPDLKASVTTRYGLTVAKKMTRTHLTAEGGFYSTRNAVYPSADSTSFRNGPDFQGLFASAGVQTKVRALRFSASATYTDRSGNSRLDEDLIVTFPDEALWIRTEAAYEGYFFNKATYAIAGFRSLFSPLAYRSMSYLPQTGQWMQPLVAEEIPGFFRMDLFLTARIREFFVYYQIENMLDGLGQAGYFETARYPMPPRRTRFGIRWVIRN
jgi:hypothetical protein